MLKTTNKLNNNFGHTLIELLVGISIIGFMSTIVVVNIRGTGQTASLDTAALKLVSDIRLIQDYALGLRKYERINDFPHFGWGIRFSRNTSVDDHNKEYRLFADWDQRIAGKADDGSDKYRFNEDATAYGELEKLVKLPDKIIISQLNVSGVTNRNYAYLIFEPPDPRIRISNAAQEDNDNLDITMADFLEITLQDTSSGRTKKIIVNLFGLIDIEN